MADGYTLVPQDVHGWPEKKRLDQMEARPPASSQKQRTVVLLSVLLVISVGLNSLFIYQRQFQPWSLAEDLPSRFAHLRRDIPTEIVNGGVYDVLNRTLQDEAWNAPEMEPWNGFLALDEDYTIAQGLPHSQRWPWDLTKGVYIMTSSHLLHCTRVLRTWVNENHDSVPEEKQTWGYPHILHCLDVLRENIMCSADDTPLYIGRLHANIDSDHPRAGIGTMKMCRNWTALLEWSHAHSACFRPEVDDEIERYKYCPDGSRPWETTQE